MNFGRSKRCLDRPGANDYKSARFYTRERLRTPRRSPCQRERLQMKEHDVVGIGNAIVDIIGRCDDGFLAKHGCVKGSMQLVDEKAMFALYDAMGPGIEISGGSVANTMAGVASFGGKAAFIGKTASDQVGTIFGHDIRAAGTRWWTRADGS